VNGTLPWPWIHEEKAVPWIEKRSGLQLADSQRAAIRLALTVKALVITGEPGVGKTTIVNSILKVFAAKGVRLLLCAPTGRAANRMTEATGVEAKTIHRLLEVDPKSGGFKRNANNPLDCDLLVVDEAPMVDVMLMQALVKATPDSAALLIVADIDQHTFNAQRHLVSARTHRSLRAEATSTWRVAAGRLPSVGFRQRPSWHADAVRGAVHQSFHARAKFGVTARADYGNRANSACASAISGISGVCTRPSSAGARMSWASTGRAVDW
jgi:hypothetical protein